MDGDQPPDAITARSRLAWPIDNPAHGQDRDALDVVQVMGNTSNALSQSSVQPAGQQPDVAGQRGRVGHRTT